MGLDRDVIIIGAGMSGIGTAAQLIRNFGYPDYEIVEKSSDLGGTWFQNTYPGCGCDVPSHFYSYSFELNPDWSRVFPLRAELHGYFRSVAEKYKIIPHIRFNAAVRSAEWDAETATWLVEIQDTSRGTVFSRQCRILISAVGALSIPNTCDIPGAQKFDGNLFHSAKWDHSFDYAGKKVVVLGNGCSATQFVPVMSQGSGAAAKITQFSQQAHWLAERGNWEYSRFFKWVMRSIPGAMRAYRAYLFSLDEPRFRAFSIEGGKRVREQWTKQSIDFIRRTAPYQYLEGLIPKTEMGCKRRVNDTGYLKCLHQPNVELIYNDPVKEITKNGVETMSGRGITADAIVLATGFQTHNFLFPMTIRGKGGITLSEHWNQISAGSASAYFGTCLSDFPNFFIMMGPNTLTGHLSVVYTVECQINFTMRVIRPIMQSLRRCSSHLVLDNKEDQSQGRDQKSYYPSSVTVTREADIRDNCWLQRKCRQMVWSTGCAGWYIDTKTGRNTQMYPDWPILFWWRSLWIRWSDFTYE